MKFGLIILLVFGLAVASQEPEDSVGLETKDIENNISFRYVDKTKKVPTRTISSDTTFNYPVATSTASSTGFKSSATTQNTPPFKYLYNQQYYQPNPYLAYVQVPQAAQIAAQYAFQPNPVAHFFQTPSQIQYVSTPAVAQANQVKYQTFSNEYSTTNSVAADTAAASSSASTGNTQYVQQPQQTAVSSAANTQIKQNPAVYQNYQTAQPFYYTQQPLFTYFAQPQAANYIYQQPNAQYLLRQQQQIANVYGANRFGFYQPTQNAQLTYLVPMIVSPSHQDATTTTTTNAKSPEKTAFNNQQTTSSNSLSFGTKN